MNRRFMYLLTPNGVFKSTTTSVLRSLVTILCPLTIGKCFVQVLTQYVPYSFDSRSEPRRMNRQYVHHVLSLYSKVNE